MNYNNLIISFLLLIIPLILLVLCYRNYMINYCNNDIKCLQDKLIINLEKMTNEVKRKRENIEKKIEKTFKKDNISNEEDEVIEGFFGGLTSWFSGSTPTNILISPNNVPNTLNIQNIPIKSSTFPPKEIQGNTEDFKDSNNSELLQQINNKVNNKLVENKNKLIENKKEKEEKKILIDNTSKKIEKLTNSSSINNDLKKIFGKCQFYNDQCPTDYQELGNFSISGMSSNTILACGNVENIKPAHAIAQIKNNSVYEIHVTDPGHGYNPSKVPKIIIEGGKGHGATAEAVIDDNGYLKLIKVINPGYNYTETPNIIIDTPFLNSSCHLCCQF